MTNPTRAEVAARWRDILAGSRSREEVHAWATPWVEGDGKIDDPLVSGGLKYLHGFDLTTRPAEPDRVRHGMGPGRVYCKSDAAIAEDLARWEQNVTFYDRDREDWERCKWLLWIRAARDERGVDAARRVSSRAIARGHLTEASASHAVGEEDTDG